ncbi:protein of unknown function (plasmid) [Cupriavidus taiwanensis]|nr:protein of unknown function [Cupriavidus taiwanensis]
MEAGKCSIVNQLFGCIKISMAGMVLLNMWSI